MVPHERVSALTSEPAAPLPHCPRRPIILLFPLVSFPLAYIAPSTRKGYFQPRRISPLSSKFEFLDISLFPESSRTLLKRRLFPGHEERPPGDRICYSTFRESLGLSHHPLLYDVAERGVPSRRVSHSGCRLSPRSPLRVFRRLLVEPPFTESPWRRVTVHAIGSHFRGQFMQKPDVPSKPGRGHSTGSTVLHLFAPPLQAF